LIAILAEEGDDLSSIEVPSRSAASDAAESSSNQTSEKSANEQQKQPSPPRQPQADPASPNSSTAYQPPESVQHDHHYPTHSKPLLPSVLRALVLNNIKDTSQIKATGFKGTLTKGDVLAFAGKITHPRGSLKDIDDHALPGGEKQLAKPQPANAASAPKPELIDGPSLRQLIAAGLSVQLKPKPVVHQKPANPSDVSGKLRL
jgi:pyruvate/2-oxoglutarate dehydrogenase complex dihydrolipoamide acyltransferase (E2) component